MPDDTVNYLSGKIEIPKHSKSRRIGGLTTISELSYIHSRTYIVFSQ